MHPPITISPAITNLGKDSPVNDFVSILETPSTTVPSNGIFSPGFTNTISSISTQERRNAHGYRELSCS